MPTRSRRSRRRSATPRPRRGGSTARDTLVEALARIERIGAVLRRPWLPTLGALAPLFGGAREDGVREIARGIDIADAQEAAVRQLHGGLFQAGVLVRIGQAEEGRVIPGTLIPQSEAAGIRLARPMLDALRAEAHADGAGPASAGALSIGAVRRVARTGAAPWAPAI